MKSYLDQVMDRTELLVSEMLVDGDLGIYRKFGAGIWQIGEVNPYLPFQ